MSKKASPRTIGAFVLGAIALAVAGAITFGSGAFFTKSEEYVLFFNESLKGLRVGASVVFRGVTLGTVTNIRAIYDVESGKVLVPVRIRTIDGTVAIVGEADSKTSEPTIEKMIDRGMRAQLQSESFVTGQLFIAVDFHPDNKADLKNYSQISLPEIPTIPSALAQFSRGFDDLMAKAPQTLDSIEKILKSVESTLGGDQAGNLQRSLQSISDILDKLDDPDGDIAVGLSHFPSIMANVEEMSRSLPQLAEDIERLTSRLDLFIANADSSLISRDTVLGDTLGKSGDMADAVRKMSDQFNLMVAENREGLRDFSETGVPDLIGLIEDMTRMVNEFDSVLRDMRQDPSRFFFGNETSQGISVP